LDIKKLGRIGRIGHRIHGDRRRRIVGIGWEYLHVCIDDATRLAYGEVLDDECAETAIGFLRRATAWFASLDVRVERVLTDNGSAYRSHRFRAAVHALGARHLRTRPYTPRTNGKAERFIRTALEKWAYVRAYRTSRERTAALLAFLA
jgi:transposase InsO family protein